MDDEIIENSVRHIIDEIGEDVKREGVKATPKRVTRLYKNLFYRYNKKLLVMDEDERNNGDTDEKSNIIPITIFKQNYREMLVREVNGISFCEHHMVPFTYTAYVGIIPNDTLLGMNKIDKIVKYFSAGLQIQERLTSEIADWINDNLKAKGVVVLIEGQHFCAELQGDNGSFTTSAVRGEFLIPTKGNPLNEFLHAVQLMKDKKNKF